MLLWSIPSSCSPSIAPRTSQATAQIDSKSMTVPFSQIKSSRVELDTKSKHIRLKKKETYHSKSVILLVIKFMEISICLIIKFHSSTTYKLFPCKSLIFVLPCSIFRSLATKRNNNNNKKKTSKVRHYTFKFPKKGSNVDPHPPPPLFSNKREKSSVWNRERWSNLGFQKWCEKLMAILNWLLHWKK